MSAAIEAIVRSWQVVDADALAPPATETEVREAARCDGRTRRCQRPLSSTPTTKTLTLRWHRGGGRFSSGCAKQIPLTTEWLSVVSFVDLRARRVSCCYRGAPEIARNAAARRGRHGSVVVLCVLRLSRSGRAAVQPDASTRDGAGRAVLQPPVRDPQHRAEVGRSAWPGRDEPPERESSSIGRPRQRRESYPIAESSSRQRQSGERSVALPGVIRVDPVRLSFPAFHRSPGARRPTPDRPIARSLPHHPIP
jgi:hypothetical protein